MLFSAWTQTNLQDSKESSWTGEEDKGELCYSVWYTSEPAFAIFWNIRVSLCQHSDLNEIIRIV